MTATRDRRSDLDDSRAEPAWDERPILGRSRGLPWWGAVLLAFGLTALAAVVDMQLQDTLGKIFQGTYIISCIAAICLVRRANLFGPMVQPPLVFAITAIVANVALAPADDGGLKKLLLTIGIPLTSNFPTMALTTGITIGLGVVRLFTQRDPARGEKAVRARSDSRPGPRTGSRERGAGARKPRETRERD
ncbi:hypothetical protein JOD54_002122 [Actinokineospora baliensis]|uniref:DUF6542 domain-containing protein n=1 Tax=Actinokineospora baliensis TaxID=547056 RepID=UPI0019598832|nr:DUF6542 domain-containing protein [Actinokineospora baliensis]MBM7771918.1 hypothetical protein [Actinokineospora baliensis]